MLVGNKVDLANVRRQVDFSQALQLSKELDLAGCLEMSAKDGGETVDDAFFIVATNAFDNQTSIKQSR